MALTEFVIMPGDDYQAICDKVREKTGGEELLKSGDIPSALENISGGGEKILYMDAALLDAGGAYPADADDYTTAVIPAEATYVSLDVFDNLPNIDTVIVNGDCEFETYGKYDSTAKATIYLNALVMSELPIRKVEVRNRTEVESYFLYGLAPMLELVLENCGQINNRAFCNCYALRSTTLNNITGHLPGYAFGMSYSLREVVLPESLGDVYKYAFNSSGLKKVIFLSKTASIEQNAFPPGTIVRCYSDSAVSEWIRMYGYYEMELIDR